MRITRLVPGLLFAAAAAINIHVFCKDDCLKPVVSEKEHVVPPKPKALHASPVEANPTQSPPAPKLSHMEKDLSDLEHEIERGEYVRQINSSDTSPEIKAELREKIRQFARLAIEISQVRRNELQGKTL